MKHRFTIFFTFFADGEIRRKYIEIALNTLFKNSNKDIPMIVIDSSSKNEYLKNKKLFSDMPNLDYIHDENVNPFKRCNKYLHLIKTDFVLRLLEDCAYVNFSYNNFEYIKKDIELMKSLPDINIIQYPIINEQEFRVDGNTVYYPAINFCDKKIDNLNGYEYYDRSQERGKYHYLCNNILYRTDFFNSHWNYITNNYIDHSSAESSKTNSIFSKFFSKFKYARGIAVRVVKLKETVFYSDVIITNIVISETMKQADVIHIGYYSTEINMSSNSSVREITNNIDGATSVINNLSIFNDADLLNNIKFRREKIEK
jgi:hypothetical protein